MGWSLNSFRSKIHMVACLKRLKYKYDDQFLENLIKMILLKKEKADLEEKLQESFKNLEDSKSYINTLVEQTKQEKRNRARSSKFQI